MRHREYREDQVVQDLSWVHPQVVIRTRLDGHGECDECGRDINCNCEHEVRVHWCRRHGAMESE